MVSAFFLMWAWRLMHQNLENRLLDPEPFRINEHAACLPVKGLRSFQALIFFLVPGVVALWYRRLSKQISAARAKHRFPQWGEINDKS